MMYDPKETDASHHYLLRILKEIDPLEDGMAVIGGWAVYYHVREEFTRATGYDYLRSRDIDMIISSKKKDVVKIKDVIGSIGFIESGLPFRYQLIIDWDTGKPIVERVARKKAVHEIMYIYLDLFSELKLEIGTWPMPEVKGILKDRMVLEGIPVVKARALLGMKMRALMERDNLEKRQKDACDIYCLLFYSSLSLKKNEREEIDAGLKNLSNEYSGVIAEQLFRDRGLSGIVRRRIEHL